MTVHWGILGCGDVARKRVAAAIQQAHGSELLAVCRRDPERLNAFARQFDVPRAVTDEQDLINDPQIDAVYIATPVDRHLPQVLAAAAAGKHVLVEKPMGLNFDECQQMIEACRQAGVRLGVAYYRRFYPAVERIEQLLRDNAIGTVFSISAVTSTPFSIASDEDGYWRVRPEQGGGGALIDIGSHRLNLFEHLLGPIDSVKAFQTTRAADYPAENVFIAALRFASGALGSLQCYFGTPVDPDELTILGSQGCLRIAPLNRDSLQITTPQGSHTETLPPPRNFSLPLIEDFVAAIHERREPRVSGIEGAAATRIIDAMYASARETE